MQIQIWYPSVPAGPVGEAFRYRWVSNLMVPACWLFEMRAQYRVNGSCLSSLYLEAIQLNFSLYVSDAFQASLLSLLELRVSAHEWVNPCAQVSISILSHLDRQNPHFHSQVLWELLFMALVVWPGESCVGLGPLVALGETLQPRYPSGFSTATCGCETSLFHISVPPTFILTWLLFILTCKTSV